MADPADVAHLLRRTEFVARPSRISALQALPLSAAVDDVLNVPPTSLTIPAEIATQQADHNYEQFVFALHWWLDRMVDAPRPVAEKMALFWHGHFCTSWDKVFDTGWMMEQHKLFRDQALGNFRALAHGMSQQLAMLIYLDGIDNHRDSPNQNFARELMELFVLGVGQYSEDDVVAAARAWTGYGIDWTTRTYRFWPADHDDGPKTFFGTTRNWDGPGIIDEILRDDAAKKRVASRFLARKLWEFFAHPNPPQVVVDAIGDVLLASDMEVKPALRALLLRPEFYSDTAKTGLVRTPVEYVVAVHAQTGLRCADTNPEWTMEAMGQMPFRPPNVAGWKPNRYWVNTSAWAARTDFARRVTWKLREGHAWDHLETDSPGAAIASLEQAFAISLAPPTRAAMAGFFAAEQYWWRATNALTMTMLAPELHLA